MGEAWYHWAIGAAIVAACAVAVVVTAGGVLAGATAVGMVASGMAATTTATTVAASTFLGSATIYGSCVLSAGFESKSIREFNDKGNWGTVAATAGGAAFGALMGFITDRNRTHNNVTNTSSNATVEVLDETVPSFEVPEYVKSSRTFISWIRNFEKNSTFLKQDQIKQLIDIAKSYDVKIDYHIGGHPNTLWENISHLHFGNARIHIATADEMIDWVSQYLDSLV